MIRFTLRHWHQFWMGWHRGKLDNGYRGFKRHQEARLRYLEPLQNVRCPYCGDVYGAYRGHAVPDWMPDRCPTCMRKELPA